MNVQYIIKFDMILLQNVKNFTCISLLYFLVHLREQLLEDLPASWMQSVSTFEYFKCKVFIFAMYSYIYESGSAVDSSTVDL